MPACLPTCPPTCPPDHWHSQSNNQVSPHENLVNKQLGREALNIVEDSIQDMGTYDRNLGCNSAQDC